jgi:beta-N-acetylhexosaminidase
MTDVLRKDMNFHGLLVTDAMTMGGVANRYGATEPLVLALQAGADILLMPHSVTEAITTITGAIASGRLTQDRIDQSVRRVLRMKAQAGLRTGRLVDLNAVDTIVNTPARSSVANEVAEKSITLARDNMNAVPLAASVKKILSITYASESDLLASRIFNQELRGRGYRVVTMSADARSTPAELDAIRAQADSADVIIASAYVFPRESQGTIGTQGGFSALVEQLAVAKKNLVAISFGNPYLVSAFPSVPAYMLAWGSAPVSQKAAAQALLGLKPISGKLPISIPPGFKAGDGIDRAARAAK